MIPAGILDQREGRESVTTAQAGRIEPGGEGGRRLVLNNGARTDLDITGGTRTISRFDQYEVRIGEKAMAQLQERPPKALDTLDLRRLAGRVDDLQLVHAAAATVSSSSRAPAAAPALPGPARAALLDAIVAHQDTQKADEKN